MPSSILNTDIMFPNLSGKSTEQQVFTIMNYLYMLKEQLTYSLSNLGLDNINANSFIEIAGIINQPVILRLDGVDGSLAEINVNLGTVSSQLQDAEGNISSLQQTVSGLRITASNGTQSSTLTLTSNGVQLSSTNVQITGMVTFTDLSTSGRTTINGGNITTGVISAIDISSVTIDGSSISGSTFETVLTAYGVGGEIKCYYLSNIGDTYLAGGLRLDDQGGSGDSTYRMFLYTRNALGVAFALKLESAGSMSLSSGNSLWMYAPNTVQITGSTIKMYGTVYVNDKVIS